MEKTKHKIEVCFPEFEVELAPRESRGDLLQDVPLQTVEGSDFFTQDIFDELIDGTADIAVHSLKDMSADHFFGPNKFAVIDRNDIRDVAIFNKDVEKKIQLGKTIVVGTCSPRREKMAIEFLQKALPQWHPDFVVETKVIRGNVDSRLQKLGKGEYDAIILATAGINRLLESPQDAYSIRILLSDKKLMLLPLVECVPAPCQGAIVAEAHPSNALAVKIIEAINDPVLYAQCMEEKKVALQHGKGCLQKFGVATVQYDVDKTVVYAAGENQHGTTFSHWSGLPEFNLHNEVLFSATNHMGSFFSYTYKNASFNIQEPNVYIANYKAVKDDSLIHQLRTKNVWAAGTKTWYELANQQIWVSGSADAFGLEFLNKCWSMPLLNISKENTCIITGNHAVDNWKKKGWNAVGTYIFNTNKNEIIETQISESTLLFWTSIHQFIAYKAAIKPNAIHLCPSGETAELLRASGINPIVFPTLKSFLQWKG